MTSKHLIIIGIWSFLISSIILLFLYDFKLQFFGYIVLLFAGFIFSVITASLPITE